MTPPIGRYNPYMGAVGGGSNGDIRGLAVPRVVGTEGVGLRGIAGGIFI